MSGEALESNDSLSSSQIKVYADAWVTPQKSELIWYRTTTSWRDFDATQVVTFRLHLMMICFKVSWKHLCYYFCSKIQMRILLKI